MKEGGRERETTGRRESRSIWLISQRANMPWPTIGRPRERENDGGRQGECERGGRERERDVSGEWRTGIGVQICVKGAGAVWGSTTVGYGPGPVKS